MPHTARVALVHLRAWRTQNILTVAELAKRAGVAQSTVIDLENAHTSANPKTIHKLAEALGITPSQLLQAPEGTPNPKEEPPQLEIDWEGEQGKELKKKLLMLLFTDDMFRVQDTLSDMRMACKLPPIRFKLRGVEEEGWFTHNKLGSGAEGPAGRKGKQAIGD